MSTVLIGPSFPAELEAAGLLTLPISWSENGVDYGDIGGPGGTVTPNPSLSAQQRADIEAVIAAHDPTSPAPAAVPETVTKYQCCVVLARHQLLAQTSAFFSNMAADDPRRLAWEMAAAVHRHSASTLDAIQHLGLSAVQADAMFIEAIQVE